MGKVRTRVLGNEEVEEKQKKEQKVKTEEKKALKATSKGKDKKKLSKAVEVLKEAEAKAKNEEQSEESDVKETKPEKAKKEKKVVASEKVKTHVRGKKYKGAEKHVSKDKIYSLKEAISTLKKIKYAKFDESVELHLNTDEAGLKGEIQLPHSTGKIVRTKIVDDKVLDEIEAGKFDFDVLITHPSFMPKLAKYARVLGPKGLMPNPKAGTVSQTPEEVVKKFAKGTLRWKTEEKFPLIHQMIGKISAEDKALSENAQTFIQSVGKVHIKQAYIKTTMSPSVKIDIETV